MFYIDISIEGMMKRGKLGQITPIIIVAIVLVIGFGIYFVIPEGQIEKVDPDVEPIYNYVQGCLEESAKSAVLDIASQGGYFSVPEENFNGFPYYVKNGRNLRPNNDVIGNSLSEYVGLAVSFCLKDFKDFPSFDVSGNEIEVNAVITDQRVDFTVKYPLKITKEDKVFEVENFKYIVDARLGTMINLAELLVNDQIEHSISLCLSCGQLISTEYEMAYNNLNLGDGDFLHSISDNKIKINNEPLEFNFAMKLEVGG